MNEQVTKHLNASQLTAKVVMEKFNLDDNDDIRKAIEEAYFCGALDSGFDSDVFRQAITYFENSPKK